MVDLLRSHGRDVVGAHIFEVGTGHMVDVPIALWLCGAASTTTIDLNPYLSPELVVHHVRYLREHRAKIVALFGEDGQSALFSERFRQLTEPDLGFTAIAELIGLRYLAPADATHVATAANMFDYHISFTVLEHIPADTIGAILQEGKRILKDTGLFVHIIDLSDHFSHGDKRISSVNFLRFDPQAWDWWAGNRYMYQNRLRAAQYRHIFAAAGLNIVTWNAKVDSRSLHVLQHGFPLAHPFIENTHQENATVTVQVVAAP
ncbi:MAG: methyltransferase domain-containing protein [Oscillochloris sp.]|nr:methyltransferase domain-containing protein [Oscillochloris sp.]